MLLSDHPIIVELPETYNQYDIGAAPPGKCKSKRYEEPAL